MAQALYNQLTDTNDATSAGIEVSVGKPIHEDVLRVLENHDIAAEGLFRKQLTQEMFDGAEQVYLMTDRQPPAFMQGSPKVVRWGVPDPRDKGLEVHEEVFQMIEDKVTPLTEKHD